MSKACLRTLKPRNSSTLPAISSWTSLMVLNLWSLWLPKSAQCGQSFTRSLMHMISKSFLCSSQKSLSVWLALALEIVSLEDYSSAAGSLERSLSCLLREMFLGKYSRLASATLSSWPQCWHTIDSSFRRRNSRRHGVHELCSQ